MNAAPRHESELLPCPFCGGKPIWQESKGGQAANFDPIYRINCSECYRIDMPMWSDKIDCIKQWNARTPVPQCGVQSRDDNWEDDPSADERWNAGVGFAMAQLCAVLGVDMESVTWDAATETVDGDVQAVIGNIMRARYGDEWSGKAALSLPDTARGPHILDALCVTDADNALLRTAMKEACDLLTERTHGNPARSAGHNARLRLERALALSSAEPRGDIDVEPGSSERIRANIAASLSSAERRTDNAPKCGFCGRAVFGPCMSKAQAAGCELPPSITSTERG